MGSREIKCEKDQGKRGSENVTEKITGVRVKKRRAT